MLAVTAQPRRSRCALIEPLEVVVLELPPLYVPVQVTPETDVTTSIPVDVRVREYVALVLLPEAVSPTMVALSVSQTQFDGLLVGYKVAVEPETAIV